jgi:hypothetical protein
MKNLINAVPEPAEGTYGDMRLFAKVPSAGSGTEFFAL